VDTLKDTLCWSAFSWSRGFARPHDALLARLSVYVVIHSLVSRLPPAPKIKALLRGQQARMLNVHEYISMDIMKGYGIATPTVRSASFMCTRTAMKGLMHAQDHCTRASD
jgi:hypothetical protein